MNSIVTENLVLCPGLCSRNSLEKQVTWLNDPDIVQYSEQRYQRHTIESQIRYITSFVWPNQFFEIYKDGGLVGTITSYVELHNGVADLGLLIGKEFWRQGIGAEAWRGLRDYLFRIPSICKIEAGMMALNFGMIGICIKTGMTEEGRRIDHFALGHSRCDLVMYGQVR